MIPVPKDHVVEITVGECFTGKGRTEFCLGTTEQKMRIPFWAIRSYMVYSADETCGCGRPIRYTSMTDTSKNACNKYGRCPTYDEQRTQILELKEALRKAMFCREITTSKCVKGNVYKRDWNNRFKTWAGLAGIDLSQYDPTEY